MPSAHALTNGVGIGEVSPPPVETCTIRYVSPSSSMYSREPSVATTPLPIPSRVSCVVANTLGGGGEELSQANVAAPIRITSKIAIAHCQLRLRARAGPATASTFPEVVSRFSRFRSARISAADWQRMSLSFSRALLMIRSSSAGTSGFSRTGATGACSRIALKISAEVSPRKGSVPVHISYRTAPNENRSVRASSSLPRTCSGDM